jgi:CRISPR/Cas system Type II protein with McrA/HNH and RuvC-like nuclease domain
MKKCSTCKFYKPKSKFYYCTSISNKDKLSSNCKECTRKKVKEWKKNNPEKVQRQKREYRERPENIILMKKYWKIYYEKNKYRLSKNAWRFEVLTRDNFTCCYCGRKSPEVKLEIDHIRPKSKGGINHISNYITACRECNKGKFNNELTRNAP